MTASMSNENTPLISGPSQDNQGAHELINPIKKERYIEFEKQKIKIKIDNNFYNKRFNSKTEQYQNDSIFNENGTTNEEKLVQRIKDKIRENIKNESFKAQNVFESLHPMLKLLMGVSFVAESYYLWSLITVQINNDNSRIAPLNQLVFAIKHGIRGLHGAGGFLLDIYGFLESIQSVYGVFGDTDRKRRWTMAFWTTIILLVIFPAVSYIFKAVQESTRTSNNFFHVTGEPIILVLTSFILTLLAVFFGHAMRYWSYQVLYSRLLSTNEERSLCKKSKKGELNKEEEKRFKKTALANFVDTNGKITWKETTARLIVGVPIGIVGTILLPWLKPIILNNLSKIVSNTSFFYRYTEFAIGAGIALLGIHCALLRVLIPLFLKIFSSKLLYTKAENPERAGQPKTTRTIIAATVMYVISMAMFGVGNLVDKMQYFSNPIVQTLVNHSALFFAIAFNICGAFYIFKTIMKVVRAGKLTDELLSSDQSTVDNAKDKIKWHKRIGAGMIISGTSLMIGSIVLFIVAKTYSIEKLENILENIYFVAPVILLFSCIMFIGMALNGKTKFIENKLKGIDDQVIEKTAHQIVTNGLLNDNKSESSPNCTTHSNKTPAVACDGREETQTQPSVMLNDIEDSNIKLNPNQISKSYKLLEQNKDDVNVNFVINAFKCQISIEQ